MKHVYATSGNIISPLGFDTASNYIASAKATTAIQMHDDKSMLPVPFYASLLQTEKLTEAFSKIGNPANFTRLEQMMLLSVQDSITQENLGITEKTALIVATTKGNIDALEENSNFDKNRAYLPVLGKSIKDFFGFKKEAIVVSNACVSGILAVAVAKRLIQVGVYDDAVIVAGDIISKFTLSGFHSFQALSEGPCKPYSKFRNGVSLGEGAASLIISAKAKSIIKITGEASCNDANHISGPSRTGAGLFKSITAAMHESGLSPNELDYISAHGTATIYNDEMESIALNRSNMLHVPINSFKGIYGHTLGASGLLETVLGLESMKRNELLQSVGFDELGVSKSINVIKQFKSATVNNFLKTASGFGGCNTAVIFQKDE